MHALLYACLAAQTAAAAVVLRRLLPGARRMPPVQPRDRGPAGAVTVIVPTYNEAKRLAPCLAGLARQGDVLAEVLVVDSRSTDGTRELVARAAALDPRLRLLVDPPRPPGWIGKVWALQHGLSQARAPWVLGVDADTVPDPGLVAGALAAAEDGAYDVVSFSPRFAHLAPAERWLQPAMLATLVYRTGVPGGDDPGRVLANGQCFLARRRVLEAAGGYEAARASWADDVTLARFLARRGARVGFLDGSRLFDVRAYASAREMWREWGRSVDLADATPRGRQWMDLAMLALAQAAPLWIAIAAAGVLASGAGTARLALAALLAVNAVLLVLRGALLWALRGSYAERGVLYWLSPLADPAAVFRIFLSTVRRPRRWRGREFAEAAGDHG
ncbi:MAG TPA: glycosyltransferase [Gemmatimonadaceae bacterium]